MDYASTTMLEENASKKPKVSLLADENEIDFGVDTSFLDADFIWCDSPKNNDAKVDVPPNKNGHDALKYFDHMGYFDKVIRAKDSSLPMGDNMMVSISKGGNYVKIDAIVDLFIHKTHDLLTESTMMFTITGDTMYGERESFALNNNSQAIFNGMVSDHIIKFLRMVCVSQARKFIYFEGYPVWVKGYPQKEMFYRALIGVAINCAPRGYKAVICYETGEVFVINLRNLAPTVSSKREDTIRYKQALDSDDNVIEVDNTCSMLKVRANFIYLEYNAAFLYFMNPKFKKH